MTGTTYENRKNVKNGTKRFIFAALSLLSEVVFIVMLFTKLNEHAEWISAGTRVFALILVLTIYGKHQTSSMKTPWIILILVFPILGVCLYLLVGLNGTTNKMKKRYKEINRILVPELDSRGDSDIAKKFAIANPSVSGLSTYLSNTCGYPIYNDTDIQYFPEASEGIEEQKKELRKAETFIFMEYHAIEDAESWRDIQVILEEKVREGVEVRVFYDDMGSIGFINTDFIKRLEVRGIKARVFNPFTYGLNIFYNNRDHRKITVIDGKVGFTGGYNIANEYFNITHPFGYWKDTGIKITGGAVRSLTIMFLEMWNSVRSDNADDTYFEKYLPMISHTPSELAYVQPYGDNPMDNEQTGENVYISVAEQAQKYAWFVTPYLILTDEMIHALGLAAKRGVDVRVITPGIPDKKLVYAVTRSYYNTLTRSGVKVYEYTPGFCHCKMCVSDDVIATNGTINLDYRSLYHHFENGCLYADCKAVLDTKKDFDEMIRVSRDVTDKYTNGRASTYRLWQLFLRLFAPLM
jgi:cardiolipin synthase